MPPNGLEVVDNCAWDRRPQVRLAEHQTQAILVTEVSKSAYLFTYILMYCFGIDFRCEKPYITCEIMSSVCVHAWAEISAELQASRGLWVVSVACHAILQYLGELDAESISRNSHACHI